MNVVTAINKDNAARSAATAPAIGLIIPSVNTYSEPQFTHFAPDGLGIHVARARVAGEWKRPLPDMAGEIATAAKLLSDCHPDMIVFHCTDTSMTQGPQGEGRILDIVKEATGIEALATSKLVREGLEVLGIKKMILLTPYKSNKAVIDYLTASGFTVLRDKAMNLEAKDFGSVTPAQWAQMAKETGRAGRRRRVPVLHQHHPDRGDRRHRAAARQAGGQQQPGGAVGLREAAEKDAAAAQADAGAGPADGASRLARDCPAGSGGLRRQVRPVGNPGLADASAS